MDFNWKDEIRLWTNSKRTAKHFQGDLIALFQKAFDHTSQPEKALFGTTKSSIAVVVGGIYLVAIHSTDTISLLLDQEFKGIPNTQTNQTKSTKSFKEPLYWLETSDLTILRQLIEHQEIWESYSRASHKIYENNGVTSHRDHIAKNKIPISLFWKRDNLAMHETTMTQIENDFQEKVLQALHRSKFLGVNYVGILISHLSSTTNK